MPDTCRLICVGPDEVEAFWPHVKGLIAHACVRSLYDLGMADGDLQRSEQDVLKRIVGAFNLSDEALREITAQYFGKGDANYAALGITEDASDEEIKSAYRKLAAEHHPDRSSDGGEKFRLVKDAYEALKKLRGL